MAGGENARIIVCPTCLYQEGAIVPAQREAEGIETDWYRCGHGHRNGISWDGEPLPGQPMWPASEKQREAARVVRECLDAGTPREAIPGVLVERGLLG